MYDAPLTNDGVVFDLGGFHGEYTDDILTICSPTIRIFEPHPGYAKRLKKKFSQKTKIFIHPCGASNSNHKTELYFASIGSTTYEGVDNTGKKTQVAMRDMQEFTKPYDSIDIMKINIEGGEYDVLDRLLETGEINKIRTFYIQFHEWIPKSYSRRKKIINELKKTHTCDWSYYFVWEKWSLKKKSRQ